MPAPLSVAQRLQSLTDELRAIQGLLVSESEIDDRILTDFRDAVNRVRTTAWGIEQYAQTKTTHEDPVSVLSVLAGERVRLIYQLCKSLQSDLENEAIRFKRGQLAKLQEAVTELAETLAQGEDRD